MNCAFLAVCFLILGVGSCVTSPQRPGDPPRRTVVDLVSQKWEDLWKGRYMIGGKVIPPFYYTQSDVTGRVNGIDVTRRTDTATIDRAMKQMSDAIAEGKLVVVMPDRNMEIHIFEVGTLDRMEAAYQGSTGKTVQERERAVVESIPSEANANANANACGDWCEPIAVQFVAQHQ